MPVALTRLLQVSKFRPATETHDRDKSPGALQALRPAGTLSAGVCLIWAIICAGARPDGVLAVRLLPF